MAYGNGAVSRQRGIRRHAGSMPGGTFLCPQPGMTPAERCAI